jgi:hypothetical protein
MLSTVEERQVAAAHVWVREGFASAVAHPLGLPASVNDMYGLTLPAA